MQYKRGSRGSFDFFYFRNANVAQIVKVLEDAHPHCIFVQPDVYKHVERFPNVFKRIHNRKLHIVQIMFEYGTIDEMINDINKMSDIDFTYDVLRQKLWTCTRSSWDPSKKKVHMTIDDVDMISDRYIDFVNSLEYNPHTTCVVKTGLQKTFFEIRSELKRSLLCVDVVLESLDQSHQTISICFGNVSYIGKNGNTRFIYFDKHCKNYQEKIKCAFANVVFVNESVRDQFDLNHCVVLKGKLGPLEDVLECLNSLPEKDFHDLVDNGYGTVSFSGAMRARFSSLYQGRRLYFSSIDKAHAFVKSARNLGENVQIKTEDDLYVVQYA